MVPAASYLVPMETAMNIIISRKKIITALCLLSIVLIALSVIGQIYKYTLNDGMDRYLTTVFNLDEEFNIPSFFMTLMLLLCSMLLVVIGESKIDFEGRYRWHWTILGIIFFFMAMDEMIMLHEMTISPVRNLLNTGGLFYFAWVIPAGLFLLVLFLYYLKFLLDLPARFRWLFILSGAIYITGVMGMEMVTGLIASRQGMDNLFYALFTNFEETLEMVGIILFIYSLFSYIKSLGKNPTFNIE